jgi:hypothetical protein
MNYHKDDCMGFVVLSISTCKRLLHIFCGLVILATVQSP